MLRQWSLGVGALLAVSVVLALSSYSAAEDDGAKPPTPVTATSTAGPMPFLLKPDGHQFKLLKNWTFGTKCPDATVHNKTELDQDFYYRYIWENGKLDKFSTYWSYHRDYPEGDAKSLHVLGDRTLTLKGRIPRGGGLRDRGIESGMLRGKIPVTPGMYIEMPRSCPVASAYGRISGWRRESSTPTELFPSLPKHCRRSISSSSSTGTAGRKPGS